MTRLVVFALLAACTSSSTSTPASQPPAPPPSPTPTPQVADAATPSVDAAPAPTGDAPKLGEDCGPGDRCATGLECVAYYGIAGARGPQFKSCEQRCGGKGAQCPSGTKCVTIADGPGQVCRP